MDGVVTPVNIIAFIVVLVIAATAAYVYKNGVPSGNPAAGSGSGPDSEDAEVGKHCQKKVLKMFKSFGCELSKDGKTLKSDQPIPHGLGRKFTLADATRAVIDMAVDQQMNASAPPREPPSRASAGAARYPEGARPAQGPPPGLGIPDASPVPQAADAYDDGGIGVGGALPAGFQMSEEEMAKYSSQPN